LRSRFPISDASIEPTSPPPGVQRHDDAVLEPDAFLIQAAVNIAKSRVQLLADRGAEY
jgi:hypothetical protein